MEEEVEIWKPIPEFEGHYECSSFGRIKSVDRKGSPGEKIMATRLDRNGYCSITLKTLAIKKTIRVHRLVGILFVPNPFDKPDVGHLDENPGNPHHSNLEWCTTQENVQYLHRRGLLRYSRSKLTTRQVLEIFKSKKTTEALMIEYKSAERTIERIRIGETWRHVTGGKHIRKAKPFSEKDVLSIFNSKLTGRELAVQYNVTETSIHAIRRGQSWSKVTGKGKSSKTLKLLTDREVLDIFHSPETNAVLRSRYGVSKGTISAIKTGKRHSKLTSNT